MKEAYPPLAEVRDTYKVSWYRCPIAAVQLKVLTTRSNLKGTAQSLGYLALLVVVGGAAWYFFSIQLWIPMAVVLFLYGTIYSFTPGLVTHELSHGTVFRTKWPNALFLRFYSLLGWTNFHQYKRSHTYHHLYTLHPRGDREVVLPYTPSLHPVRMFLIFTFNFEGFWNTLRATVRLAFLGRFTTEWLDALYPPGEKKALRQARTWAWILLLFHAAVIAISAVFHLWPLIILVTIGMFIANWWSYFIGVTMHTGLRDNVNDFRLCVRTIRLDPFSRFIYWYMNFHLEHHMFAAVPCYNLGRLHKLLAPDMPKIRTLASAWKEMRETWKRQKSEPGFQFDTPLPRKKPGAAAQDPLGASLGNLAPRGLE